MVVLPETKVEDEFYLVGVGKVKVSEMMKSVSEKADLEMQIRVNSAKESAEEKAKMSAASA